MKVCTKQRADGCDTSEPQPLNNFYRKGFDRNGAPKISAQCKVCEKAAGREAWKAKYNPNLRLDSEYFIPEVAIKLSRMRWV